MSPIVHGGEPLSSGLDSEDILEVFDDVDIAVVQVAVVDRLGNVSF